MHGIIHRVGAPELYEWECAEPWPLPILSPCTALNYGCDWPVALSFSHFDSPAVVVCIVELRSLYTLPALSMFCPNMSSEQQERKVRNLASAVLNFIASANTEEKKILFYLIFISS